MREKGVMEQRESLRLTTVVGALISRSTKKKAQTSITMGVLIVQLLVDP